MIYYFFYFLKELISRFTRFYSITITTTGNDVFYCVSLIVIDSINPVVYINSIQFEAILNL